MHHVQIRGLRYYFEYRNPGCQQHFLMLHSDFLDHTMWNYQLSALWQYNLILPDLRGHGRSRVTVRQVWLEEHALDLVYLLDFLKVKKVHIIGASFGGEVAAEFVRLFPHRVQSIVIIGTDLFPETCLRYKQRLELAGKLSSIGMKLYANENITNFIHPHTPSRTPEMYEHLYRMMAGADLRGVVASLRPKMLKRDNFSYLKTIDVPLLLIYGRMDCFIPHKLIEKMQSKLKHAEMLVIDNTGHLPNMEDPVTFNDTLALFLAKSLLVIE